MNAPTHEVSGDALDALVLDFLSSSLNSSLDWTAIAVARALDLYRGGTDPDEVRPLVRVIDSLERLVRRGRVVLVRRDDDSAAYRVRIGVRS